MTSFEVRNTFLSILFALWLALREPELEPDESPPVVRKKEDVE